MSVPPDLPRHSGTDYTYINRQLQLFSGESYAYDQYDVDGQLGHARSFCIDLATAISRIPNSPSVRSIEVFTDTLTTRDPVALSNVADELIIFARHVIADVPISIKVSRDTLVRIYCSSSSCPFNVSVTTPKGQQTVTIDLPPKCQAVDINIDGSSWEVATNRVYDPPADRFNAPSLADRILDKTLQRPQFNDNMNDHLAELMRYQLLLAASWQQRDPETAFDIGAYVLKITQKIPGAIELFTRALKFATVPVLTSPSQLAAQAQMIPVNAIKDVLEAHLMAAKTFDDALREFKGQEANASNAILAAKLALEACEEAEKSYSFLASVAKSRFESAQNSLATAQKTFQELQSEIPGAREAFEKGIKEWQIKNIAEAVIKGLVAVGMIVGSIAAACVVPPAGAGAAAGLVELPEITEDLANGAEKVEHMITFMDRIKNLYDKIKPGLEKIAQLVESIQTVVALIVKMQKIGNAEVGAEAGSLTALNVSVKEGSDLINMNADWDSFGTEMASLYEPIKQENIKGSAPFFLLVAKLVIRGKAVLAAQQAVTTTGDAYTAALAQQLMATKSTTRLREALPQIQGDPNALHLLRRNLFQRLIAVRSSIGIDFKQYVDGLTWYSLTPCTSLRLDPLKDIGDFYNDAATLQGISTKMSGDIRAQTRTFCFSTMANDGNGSTSASKNNPAPLTLATGSITSIVSTSVFGFSPDPILPCFAQLGRIRLKSFQIVLEGIKSPFVSMKVRLGEHMVDLNTVRSDPTRGDSTDVTSRLLQFSTSPMTLGFAYSVDVHLQRTVALAGDVTPALSWPSPFRSWEVSIDKAVELTGLKGISVEILCDVTVLEA